MIVLDTNVLSHLMNRDPDRRVREWLDAQSSSSIWITSVTVFEIRFGIERLEPSRRRDALAVSYETLLSEDLMGRILDFGREAAEHTARLVADLQARGRSIDLRDAMIAGMGLSRRAALATRNLRHFADAGLELIDPWSAAAA